MANRSKQSGGFDSTRGRDKAPGSIGPNDFFTFEIEVGSASVAEIQAVLSALNDVAFAAGGEGFKFDLARGQSVRGQSAKADC